MGSEDPKKAPVQFKVTSIKPIQCDAPYATPPKGQVIALALEVKIAPGATEALGGVSQLSFDSYYWKAMRPTELA